MYYRISVSVDCTPPEPGGIAMLPRVAMSHEITSEQTTILNRFYEQFDPQGEGDTRKLQQTRHEFNHLRQKLRPNSTLPDLLDILPPEIVLQCFLALPRHRSDSLNTLLTVSRRWRYFVESASTLWTQVFIEDMERGNRRAKQSLRFSRTSPLAVFIVLQPNLEIASIFQGHIDRIREITLRHRAYDMEFLSRDDLFLHAFSTLKKLGRLSSLESISYTTTFQSPLAIEINKLPLMPVIRELTGFSIRSTHTNLSLGRLVQMSLELPLPEVHALARECPKLEHLRLTGSPPSLPFERSLYDFPLLKHLEFEREAGLRDLEPLLFSRCKHLVTLQLHLTWSQLCEADYLGQMPHLTKLILNCMAHVPTSTVRHLGLPSLNHVEELHFLQIPIPPGEEIGPSQWMTNLFKTLAANMRNVGVLKLSLVQEVPVDLLLEYLSQLTKLDRLELVHDILFVDNAFNRTTLRSVKSLRLPNETLLLHVHLPRLSHLWIDSMAVDIPTQAFELAPPNATPGTSSQNPKSSSQLLKLEVPSVRELTWNGSATMGILRKSSSFTTAFASIRRLVFAEPYARKDANDFCEVILRQPSKCPHLESISFHCYPSWDLLFYMLLRRNLMHGVTISPIRSIELPGYPCTSLLSPLLGLLSSSLVFIPPLADIALNARSGVFDPSRYEFILDFFIHSMVHLIGQDVTVASTVDSFVPSK